MVFDDFDVRSCCYAAIFRLVELLMRLRLRFLEALGHRLRRSQGRRRRLQGGVSSH